MKGNTIEEYRVMKRRAQRIQRRIRQEGGDQDLLKRVGRMIQSVDTYIQDYDTKMNFIKQEKMNRKKITITLIRHGYSCANLIQDIVKKMPSKTVQERVQKIMAEVKDKRSILSINSALNNLGRLQAFYAASATKEEGQGEKYPETLAEYINKANTWGCSELLRATESGLYFFGHTDKINNSEKKPSHTLQFMPYISEEYNSSLVKVAKMFGIDIHKDNIPEPMKELKERLFKLELSNNKPYPLITNDEVLNNNKESSLYWLNKNKQENQELQPTKPSFKEFLKFLENVYLKENQDQSVHLVLISHQKLMKSFLKLFKKHNFNPIYNSKNYSKSNTSNTTPILKNYKIQNVGIWDISFTQEELSRINKNEIKFFNGKAQCLFDSQKLIIGNLTINTNRASKSFNVCDLPGRYTPINSKNLNFNDEKFNQLGYGLPGCGDYSQVILNELYKVCPTIEENNIIKDITNLYIKTMKKSTETERQPTEFNIRGPSNNKKKVFRTIIQRKGIESNPFQNLIGTLYGSMLNLNKFTILDRMASEKIEQSNS
jgi:hypothetical protein